MNCITAMEQVQDEVQSGARRLTATGDRAGARSVAVRRSRTGQVCLEA
jgi:hypothetical protein